LTEFSTEKIENLKLQPIQEVLDVLGGWPATKSSWDESSWTWQQTAKALETIGFPSSFLFEFGLEPDQKNNSRRILKVI
jgi:hypothetical protein